MSKGETMVAEYAEVRDETRSERILLEEKGGYRLEHITAGWEAAGAMARKTGECWAVTFTHPNGARGGRRFKTEKQARRTFASFSR